MTRWLSILMLFAAVTVAGESPGDTLLQEGIARFEEAYRDWDGARFEQAAELFRRAETNAPGSFSAAFWLGTAEFHRLLQLRNPGPGSPPPGGDLESRATALTDAALAALETAVARNPAHAEAHALLGTILGLKAGGGLLKAIRFGPRIQAHRRAALAHGADNPRVQFLLGSCLYHTAHRSAALREALASFLAAEKSFETEAGRPPGPLEARWGHASCLTFIGRTYERLEKPGEAREYYRRALLAHPADRLATEGLKRVSPHP